jgi:hypothetical protein
MNNGSEQANELTHCGKFVFEAAFYTLTNMTASGCNFSCLLGFVFLQPFFSLSIFFLAFILDPGLP